MYLVYLSHCNIPRRLHSPRHDSALQGRAVGTSTKAAWLPSVSAERLLSHIPRESVCRAGCLHPERPSQYGRAVWAALRTPAMCYTRSFGVEDFLASLLNMREATCQCLEHSSNLSTHTLTVQSFSCSRILPSGFFHCLTFLIKSSRLGVKTQTAPTRRMVVDAARTSSINVNAIPSLDQLSTIPCFGQR